MMINATKTELMLCGDRRQLAQIREPLKVNFMGQTVSSSDTTKNLGLIMDSELSWQSHITHITNRCFGILIGLMHARHLVPVSVLPRVVDALVLSHVRYCSAVYGSANRTQLMRLNRIFKFAARVISGRRKFDHISDVIKHLGWLSAENTIIRNDICLLHTIIINSKPEVIRSKLSYNYERVSRDTRQTNQLHLPLAHTNHLKRSFIYRTSALYNTHVIDGGRSTLTVKKLKNTLFDVLKDT